ncbi:SDR family oxidoreductase [Tellurirhabdus bombi]|uniref:SDR family oxidoreductase n=1 Tax=Tellurirhabdus bombi TaxID=2907205 RepID=UPI001F311148|nr:SDR family oxidoreductase [Tellurirhabdus bombi]
MQTVIITGGAQGIGRVTTNYLLTHGYQVSVWDSDSAALDEMRTFLTTNTDQVALIECDIADENSVQNALKLTLKQFGQVNHLINNAGIMVRKPIDQFTLDDWNKSIGINLTGAFLGAKLTASELARNRGSIINISSTRAFQSEPDTFAYSASKGGLLALTHALAVSLGPDVRANCISPGWIDVSAQKAGNPEPEKLRPKDHQQHPAGRVGQADDIARMILFLLADENSFITGQNFVVDGGMTRKMIYEE